MSNSSTNNHYSKISSFGTPGAYAPSSISRSSTAQTSDDNPFHITDVTAEFKAGASTDVNIIGGYLEPGASVLVASLAGTVTVSASGTNKLEIVSIDSATTPVVTPLYTATNSSIGNIGSVTLAESGSGTDPVPVASVKPVRLGIRQSAVGLFVGSVHVKTVILNP